MLLERGYFVNVFWMIVILFLSMNDISISIVIYLRSVCAEVNEFLSLLYSMKMLKRGKIDYVVHLMFRSFSLLALYCRLFVFDFLDFMLGLRKLNHLQSRFYLLIACLSIDIHCLLSIFGEEGRKIDLSEDY